MRIVGNFSNNKSASIAFTAEHAGRNKSDSNIGQMIGPPCLCQYVNTFSHSIEYSSWAGIIENTEKTDHVIWSDLINWNAITWINCRIQSIYTLTCHFHEVRCRLQIGLYDKMPTQILEGVNFDSISLSFHFGHQSFDQYN